MSIESAGPRDLAHHAVTRWLGTVTYLAFLLFAGSVPAEYSLVLPGVGSITRLLGALLLPLVIMEVLAGRRLRSPNIVLLLLTAFAAWSLLSVFWSVDPEVTSVRAMTHFQLLVMSWIAYEYIRTWDNFVAVLQSFVIGSLFVACVTVRDFSLVNLVALAVTDLRISAFGANPNELGLAMAITVPAALFLVRLKPRGASLLVNSVYLIIGPVAVFLTASRGAVIVLGLCALGMISMLRDMRGPAKALVAIVAAIVGVIGVSLIPSYTWQRIGSIGASLQRMDFNNRAANWSAGIDYFLNQPMFGVGAGAFQGATKHLESTSWSSHSTWVGVLVETGLVGATLLGSAIVVIVSGLFRVSAPVRRLLVAIILPMLVGMLVTGWDHRKVPWFLLTMAVVAPLVDVPQLIANRISAKR